MEYHLYQYAPQLLIRSYVESHWRNQLSKPDSYFHTIDKLVKARTSKVPLDSTNEASRLSSSPGTVVLRFLCLLPVSFPATLITNRIYVVVGPFDTLFKNRWFVVLTNHAYWSILFDQISTLSFFTVHIRENFFIQWDSLRVFRTNSIKSLASRESPFLDRHHSLIGLGQGWLTVR